MFQGFLVNAILDMVKITDDNTCWKIASVSALGS